MKLVCFLFFVTSATAQLSEFAAGRTSDQSGEFKAAISHFRMALQAGPKDAQSHS